jgi:hypothetical protein|nr:MAG TPA: hypothetical protein [Crassvirales sp.]
MEEVDRSEIINKHYDRLIEKPLEVFRIFCEFYGEELVDIQMKPDREEYATYFANGYETDNLMQSYEDGTILGSSDLNAFILVRFPKVTITNEYDQSIDIWELYAKVKVNALGRLVGAFTLNRAEYDVPQMNSNYMHSHVSDIPTYDFKEFQNPCLGEGPIRDTILTLRTEDFDELRWQLFCFELSKYVQVESIDGGPYHRMERVGSKELRVGESTWNLSLTEGNLLHFNAFNNARVKEFVTWLISRNKLKFDFNGYHYGISTTFIEWVVFISNEFIEWYNMKFAAGEVSETYADLLRQNLLRRGIIESGTLKYDNSTTPEAYANYEGAYVCTFKGEDVRIHIKGEEVREDNNLSSFINVVVAEWLYRTILQVINFEYGNSNTETQTIGAYKKIKYI